MGDEWVAEVEPEVAAVVDVSEDGNFHLFESFSFVSSSRSSRRLARSQAVDRVRCCAISGSE